MDAKSREKEALFQELNALDESESDADELSLSAFKKSKPKRSPSLSTSIPPGQRSTGSTHHSTARKPFPLQPLPIPPSKYAAIRDSPLGQVVASTGTTKYGTTIMRRTPISKSFTTVGEAKSTTMAKTGVKRKRRESLEVLPESQKIFTGLSFCTIYDSDVIQVLMPQS